MAKGDVVADMISVANNSNTSTNIRPATGGWLITNIGWSSTATSSSNGFIEVYRSDTNVDKQTFDKDSIPTVYMQYGVIPVTFNIKNSDYIKVKNVSGATEYIWWDGVVTST